MNEAGEGGHIPERMMMMGDGVWGGGLGPSSRAIHMGGGGGEGQCRSCIIGWEGNTWDS